MERFSRAATSIIATISVVIAIVSVLFSEVEIQSNDNGIFSNISLIWLIVAAFSAMLAGIVSVMLSDRIRRRLRAKKIFIIYSNMDRELAKRVSDILIDNGYHPWLDVEEILPGQSWKETSARALEESEAAVVVLSEHLAASSHAMNELETAMRMLRSKRSDIAPIIPISAGAAPSIEKLHDIQWADIDAPGGEELLLRGLALATAR